MRSMFAGIAWRCAALALFVCATVVPAAATGTFPPPEVVPEINPGSISTGLGLITAAVLLLRARMHRR